MPRVTLNDRKLSSLKATGRQVDYFDRTLPGFGVRVNPTGRKTFMLLHRVNGKLQRLTLRDPQTDVSTYPTLTLAAARELARAALQASSVGRDPGAEHRTARTQTFGALAELYVEQHARRKKRSWRDDARMIRQELAAWTDRPVGSIRRAEVRDLLEGIVTRGAPVLANRVLALVRKMLNFAVDREWLEANPAAKMARPSVEQSRSRVLSDDELRIVWKHLGQPAPEESDPRLWRLTQAALKLRLLTAQRGAEVLAMRWSDLDGSWWTIPAGIAKNKLQHRVWLSAPAVKVLATVKAEHSDGYAFAGIRGARHRRGALDGLGIADVRPHDFRRTAATMMAGGGVPRFTIARVLNHVETSVTAIYDRHSYDPEKQAALNWWATKLASIVSGKKRSTVLPFSRSA
jgi:integrase